MVNGWDFFSFVSVSLVADFVFLWVLIDAVGLNKFDLGDDILSLIFENIYFTLISKTKKKRSILKNKEF